MTVAEIEQRLRYSHRQEEDRSGHQIPTVDVAAGAGSRRDGRVLTRFGRRHPHDAEERCQPTSEAVLLGADPGLGVELPEQVGRRAVGQPEPPGHRSVGRGRDGPPPRARTEVVQCERQQLPRNGSTDGDRTGQTVAARLADHPRRLVARLALAFQEAGRVERADHETVARIDPQHRVMIGGEGVDGSGRGRVQLVSHHDLSFESERPWFSLWFSVSARVPASSSVAASPPSGGGAAAMARASSGLSTTSAGLCSCRWSNPVSWAR